MKEKNRQFLEELKAYEKQGIHMVLDGAASNPQEIYQTCILREDTSYMCDFIFKDNNKLEELYFRKINPEGYRENKRMKNNHKRKMK